ncbi:hypothetical protein B566_EDAN001959 [Ephemera danica]|nr:hypothetical protein B566_EDAN001959 [Ephemera danica]
MVKLIEEFTPLFYKESEELPDEEENAAPEVEMTKEEVAEVATAEVTEPQTAEEGESSTLDAAQRLSAALAGSELEAVDSRGETPLFWAARQGNAEAVRLLAAAGAKIGAQNKLSETCLHVACRYGHVSVVGALCLLPLDLDHREHLIPGQAFLSRLTLKVLGHSGVGKSALLDSLGAGLFASLFRRSRGPATINVSRSHPTSPSKTHIEMDVTARSRDEVPSFDSRNPQGGTRGIDVRLLSVAGVGEVSAWDFSGQEAYLPAFHHVLGINAASSVYLLVCSLEDPPPVRLQQCLFWLSFMKARISHSEPFGMGGTPRYPVRVVLVATHADSVRCPRAMQAGGEYVSTEIEWLLEQLTAHARPALRMHPRAIVLDAHVPGAPGMRALKASLLEAKQQSLQSRSPEQRRELLPAIFGRGTHRVRSSPRGEVAAAASTVYAPLAPDPIFSLMEQLSLLLSDTPCARPRGSGLLDATLRWLPNWRRVHVSFPVLHWSDLAQLVRIHVNPLASEEHLRELLHQLIFLGEASFAWFEID